MQRLNARECPFAGGPGRDGARLQGFASQQKPVPEKGFSLAFNDRCIHFSYGGDRLRQGASLSVCMSRILETSLNLGNTAIAKATASGVRSPFASVNGMALAFA